MHADLWGPYNLFSQSGNVYAVIFMRENTQKTWILYIHTKDEFIDVLQTWLPQVKNESGCKIKILWADRRGKFFSIKLKKFCNKKRIIIKYASSYLHKGNGLASHGWRTIVIMKDSLLINNGLPNDFWAKIMEISNYLQNKLPTKSQSHGKLIPKKSWTNRRQNLAYVCIFGSLVLVDIFHEEISKSDFQKTWEGIFIGYNPDTAKHFHVWALQIKQVIIASKLSIDETKQGAKLLT